MNSKGDLINFEVPVPGDKIRTKKMQMQGEVVRVQKSSTGYNEVLFKIEDGRLMKTPLENVIVIQKLEDETTLEGGMGGINRSRPAQDVSYEKVLDEVKAKWNKEAVSEKDPCWSGYKQVGTKKKGKKSVPNCVPVTEDVEFNKILTKYTQYISSN